MTWQNAINQSIRGTATRVIEDAEPGKTIKIIHYGDGPAYRLVGMYGIMDVEKSGVAEHSEYMNFNDWEPSKES